MPIVHVPEATQLVVLRLLDAMPDLSQRELSIALGLSLGKTHYVLHALLDKELIKSEISGEMTTKWPTPTC